ncbi:hypothetical protein PseudUWO311_17890 [Pseudanabaena sp. UWO311]|nr:hypothetical protein PseudUWO311_17890 [Pseudanabaena sp. UWO311]
MAFTSHTKSWESGHLQVSYFCSNKKRQKNQLRASAFDEWVINLDSGSATRRKLTQFIKRMVELSQKIDLKIRLVYYPFYPSKIILLNAAGLLYRFHCYRKLLAWYDSRLS